MSNAEEERMLVEWRDKAIDEVRAIWDECIGNQYQQIVALRGECDSLKAQLEAVKAELAAYKSTRDDDDDDYSAMEKQLATMRAVVGELCDALDEWAGPDGKPLDTDITDRARAALLEEK
jgi:hypothetical protein